MESIVLCIMEYHVVWQWTVLWAILAFDGTLIQESLCLRFLTFLRQFGKKWKYFKFTFVCQILLQVKYFAAKREIILHPVKNETSCFRSPSLWESFTVISSLDAIAVIQVSPSIPFKSPCMVFGVWFFSCSLVFVILITHTNKFRGK